MNPKNTAISITVIGILAIIGSMIVVNYPDQGKWFPVLLIGGGALLWWGVSKYRAA